MASESKRGCGYRKVGKMYLVGEWQPTDCDRLPLALSRCKCCGHGIKQARGWTRVNPFGVWGDHSETRTPISGPCTCDMSCFVCNPPDSDTHGIIWVGKRYYPKPKDFSEEAKRIGISKAVASLPKWFRFGESVVYIAHPEAIAIERPKMSDMFHPGWERTPGVFLSWRPQRIEKLFWESQRGSKEVERWERRGGTSVFIPDGDMDHDRSTPLVPKGE